MIQRRKVTKERRAGTRGLWSSLEKEERLALMMGLSNSLEASCLQSSRYDDGLTLVQRRLQALELHKKKQSCTDLLARTFFGHSVATASYFPTRDTPASLEPWSARPRGRRDLGPLRLLLASRVPEAEAGILHKATKGLGTKEDLIYPVVVGRTNVEINILKKTYYEVDLHGDFQTIILASLQAALVPYDATIHNAAKVEADVEKHYQTGRGKMGTDEEGFVDVLVSSPPEHLRIVAAAYEKKYGESLVKAAAHEFSGHAEKDVLFLIRMITEPLELLAELFESAMKGFNTDENALSSAVVRYYIVLRDIKPVYKKKYGKELRERIAEEVSGDYGELLLSVFDARD
ncbi:hypothetical protein PsorP6_001639 [Peronosclerospora sorghi]|uniref:Uncharacterized protein n=1 Tax=Peronosclerospora sorghi TaxID=230839 RepID=A0ACC0WPS0_9STRA|nr:hypothetical protein PsorP6_001639 [Peronosclerospora sorghi]